MDDASPTMPGDLPRDVIYELGTQAIATKQDIAAVRTELKQDITAVRTELKQDITEVRMELKQDITEVRMELKQDIHRMTFTIIGILGALMGILKFVT